jgi:hypothetical protein
MQNRVTWSESSNVESFYNAWMGHLAEYQTSVQIDQFFNHSYFKGLDVGDLGNHCYMQMLSDPDKEIHVTFYKPVRIR